MSNFFNNRPIRKEETVKLNKNDFSGVKVKTVVAPWYYRMLPGFVILSKFYGKDRCSQVKIPLNFKNPIPLKVKGGKTLSFNTPNTRA